MTSTAIKGRTDQIVLPTSHDMMFNLPSCYEAIHFMKHANFDHGRLKAGSSLAEAA